MKSSIRNEIKAQIIRAGYTMQEVVDQLHDEYGWSDSVKQIEDLKLRRDYDSAVAILEQIPAEVLELYKHPHKKERETAYDR